MAAEEDHETLEKGISFLRVSASQDAAAVPKSVVQEPFRSTARAHHAIRDITAQFNKHSEDLGVGELVQDDSYTLFDFVQAVEIGDPKMDTGFVPPGEPVEDDLDPASPLPPEEVVGVMDRLLRYEMAWHRGYPLSQTLFSSIHVDHLLNAVISKGEEPMFFPQYAHHNTLQDDPLVHLVLRSFCIAVIKCTDITIEMVSAKQYYEEEDLCTNTYGRVLLADYEDQDCLSLLERACEWVLNQRNQPNGLSPEICTALLYRLQARVMFMKPFAQISYPPAPIPLMKSLISRLGNIEASTSPSELSGRWFSPRLQRRLASTVPPRPPIEITLTEACNDLRTMASHIIYAFGVTRYEEIPSVQCLQNFLWGFASQMPSPLAFPRAFLQHLLFEGRVAGQQGLPNLSQYALAETSYFDTRALGDGLELDPRQRGQQVLDILTKHVSEYVYRRLCSICQNPGRIRRCLVNVLQQQRGFESRALKDVGPVPPVIGCLKSSSMIHTYQQWNVRECFKLAQQVVLIGFEQDLYLRSELGMNYWLAFQYCQGVCGVNESIKNNYHTAIRPQLHATLKEVDPSMQQDADTRNAAFDSSCEYERAVCSLCEAFALTYEFVTQLKLLDEPTTMAMAFRTLDHQGLDGIPTPQRTDWLHWKDGNATALGDMTKKIDGRITQAMAGLRAYRSQTEHYLKWSLGTEKTVDKFLDDTMKSAIELKLFVAILGGSHGKGETGQHKVIIPEPRHRRHSYFAVPKLEKK